MINARRRQTTCQSYQCLNTPLFYNSDPGHTTKLKLNEGSTQSFCIFNHCISDPTTSLLSLFFRRDVIENADE